jgi:hypothetical protein
MTRLDFFRQLAEKWKHRNDKYDPVNKDYVGHIEAKKAGKAKCTCAEHGTWDLGDGKLTDIMCPFHGR